MFIYYIFKDYCDETARTVWVSQTDTHGNKNVDGLSNYDNGTQTREKIWTGNINDRFYVKLGCAHSFDKVILRNRQFSVNKVNDGTTRTFRFVV